MLRRLQLVDLVLLVVVLLPACAHSDVLPKIGNVLNRTRDGLVAADKAVATSQALVELVCAPAVVTPEAVKMCGGAYDVISEADHAQEIARDAFRIALTAYDAVNDVALEAADGADAGVP